MRQQQPGTRDPEPDGCFRSSERHAAAWADHTQSHACGVERVSPQGQKWVRSRCLARDTFGQHCCLKYPSPLLNQLQLKKPLARREPDALGRISRRTGTLLCQVAPFTTNLPRMRPMPRVKQVAKHVRTTKAAAVTALGTAGLGLSLTGSASAHSIPTANITQSDNISPNQRFVLGEEEMADVSLATFYLFDKENADSDVQLAAVVVRRGCGGCRGCRGCAVRRGCGGCAGCAVVRGCGGCGGCGGCCARWGRCRIC